MVVKSGEKARLSRSGSFSNSLPFMESAIRKLSRLFERGSLYTLPFPLEEFLKSLTYIVDLGQLLDNLLAKLKELTNADTLYVMLFEPITNRYVGKKAKGSTPELLSEFNFSRSDNLVRWLTVNRMPLNVIRQTEVTRFLSKSKQAILEKAHIQIVFPLIVVNRLTGALFCSLKRDHADYTPEEMEMASLLTSQSALAIEHALMYQFQEDKLRRLFHADKLVTVGELAAGAAHEIRNPLTSIRSTVQYLQKDLPAERKVLVEGILEEVDRIDRIIKGLLSFSKLTELNIEVVNLCDIIDQTLLLLEPELRRHGIGVEKEYDHQAAHMMADASQLKQVFLNILLNSIQAMPHGGRLRIGAHQSDFHSVSVEVTDTGPGIWEKDLSRVFDPFYTTKEGGTGLGLSISYGIVSKHGGHIELKSVTEGPQTGTTVVVHLPKAVSKQAFAAPEHGVSDTSSDEHIPGTV